MGYDLPGFAIQVFPKIFFVLNLDTGLEKYLWARPDFQRVRQSIRKSKFCGRWTCRLICLFQAKRLAYGPRLGELHCVPLALGLNWSYDNPNVEGYHCSSKSEADFNAKLIDEATLRALLTTSQ